MLVTILAWTGCSSVQVYENQKLANQMTSAVTGAALELQNANQELALQSKVFEDLKKKSGSRRELSELVTNLRGKVEKLKISERQLREESASFSAYAHGHPRVLSTDEDYEANGELVQKIEQKIADFNQALGQFTTAAQELRKWLKDSGLYNTVKTKDLADQMQKDDQSWRAAYNQLVTNYNQAKDEFEKWQLRRPAQSASRAEKMARMLKAMHYNLGEMNQLLNRQGQLHESYLDFFVAYTTVSNLDKFYGTYQKFKSDHEQLQSDFQTKITQASRNFDDFTTLARQDSGGPSHSM